MFLGGKRVLGKGGGGGVLGSKGVHRKGGGSWILPLIFHKHL